MTAAAIGHVAPEKLRSAIASSGLKQSVISRDLRIDPALVSCWASGKRLVPDRWIEPLAQVLECSIGDLLESAHAPQSREVPQPVDEPELTVELKEERDRERTDSAMWPSGDPPHPEPKSTRKHRPKLELGVDGTPMGPGVPTHCTCGKQVR